MWDIKPWDNDGAADWFGDLMDETDIRKAWLNGINEDPEENPDIVRAAASLFIFLGRQYIWPIDHYDADLERAIAQLSRVKSNEMYQEVEGLQELIAREIQELESRRGKEKGAPEKPKKPWWKLW